MVRMLEAAADRVLSMFVPKLTAQAACTSGYVRVRDCCKGCDRTGTTCGYCRTTTTRC